MRTQARASSSTPLVSGSPKKPRIASPMNLSTVAPCSSAIVRHLGQVLVEQRGQVLRLQPLGGAGEVLDVGEEDRELLALGGDRHVLLAAEDALVDLRREVLGDLHRDRRQEVVGLGQLLVHAADQARLAALHQDEGEPGRGGEHEVGSRYLKARRLLPSGWETEISWMPRTSPTFQSRLGLSGWRVVAGDADLAHQHRRGDADVAVEQIEPETSTTGCVGVGAQRA